MHEHIARFLYYLQVHLFSASLVWCAAMLLTCVPRASATTKYWIWVATACNFILPIGAIVDKTWSTHLFWATPLGIFGGVGVVLSRSAPAAALFFIWLLGAIVMIARLCLRIRSERRNLHASANPQSPHPMPRYFTHGVPVTFALNRQGPTVNGVLIPHISLPNGIDRLLSEDELNAVLIHEVTHAKRRDNLIRLIQELCVSALWFHPFVWITGNRLALYRELSCDESVIQNAHGEDLVSALAKLANPEPGFLLQATASSFISQRLERLSTTEPKQRFSAINLMLAVVFTAVLVGGVFETVAHTACCFVLRK